MAEVILTEEENQVVEAILDARKVQEFIWGDKSIRLSDTLNISEWGKLFQKRVDKIDAINPKHPMSVVELRKRLLQQASLSIAAMAMLDKGVKLTK